MYHIRDQSHNLLGLRIYIRILVFDHVMVLYDISCHVLVKYSSYILHEPVRMLSSSRHYQDTWNYACNMYSSIISTLPPL